MAIGVDVGGTFTDIVCLRDGELVTTKVATNVQDTAASVLQGAELVDAAKASVFNHASTHGLNALITRRLPKIGFLTTFGHRDILDFGRVMRPWEAVTDPTWHRGFSDVQAPLVPRYLRRGVAERLTSDGAVLVELDEAQALEQIKLLGRCGVSGVAICLINAYVNDIHERRLRELVRQELGDVLCSISSEVSPLAKEYGRASTTVVDVCMRLVYTEYTKRLDAGLRELGFQGQLNYADSAATLVPSEHAMERPYRVVFAGPAAGTAASAHFGGTIGDENLLCADVGGTSCDISVVTNGSPYRNTSYEFEYDMLVNSLATDIVTIGAGGGSIVSINAIGELTVGPESAGAHPGPAAYGLGGTEPTTTDACLLMGLLDPGKFLGGDMPLYPELSKQAFESLDTSLSLQERVVDAWKTGLNNIAEGLFNTALRHGVDPRDYSLIAYGAAGPMLLPSLVAQARVRRVIIPPHPGLFSALGLLSSDLVYSDSRSAYTLLTADAADAIAPIVETLEQSLLARLTSDEERQNCRIVRSFDGRLYGQSWDTPFVEMPPGPVTSASVEEMIVNFHDEYERRNGNRFVGVPVEAVTFRVQLVVAADKIQHRRAPVGRQAPLRPARYANVRYLFDAETEVPEFERDDLFEGDEISGPAIIRESTSTTFVPADHRLTVGVYGELIIE